MLLKMNSGQFSVWVHLNLQHKKKKEREKNLIAVKYKTPDCEVFFHDAVDDGGATF